MLFLCARCICRIHFDTTRIAPRFVLPQSYKNSESTGPLPRFFLIFVRLQPGILNQRERMLSLRARCRLPQAGKFQMHLVASTRSVLLFHRNSRFCLAEIFYETTKPPLIEGRNIRGTTQFPMYRNTQALCLCLTRSHVISYLEPERRLRFRNEAPAGN